LNLYLKSYRTVLVSLKKLWINSKLKFMIYIIYWSLSDIKLTFPGESIRPADPVVFDRIRIGFHRNPTFFIKNRSDPTEFLSDSYRSDSDPYFVGIWRNRMKSGSDLVEFQSCSVEFRRNPDRNPTKTLSDPIEIISIRRDPITPQSHGVLSLGLNKENIFDIVFKIYTNNYLKNNCKVCYVLKYRYFICLDIKNTDNIDIENNWSCSSLIDRIDRMIQVKKNRCYVSWFLSFFFK